MADTIDWKALQAPFKAEDIEWRIQQSGLKNGKPWAQALAYVQARAIQQRLDDVISPAKWRNEFSKAPEGGILCGISIKVGDEWVTKWDGASNTEIEAVKGGLSGATKRAAVQWGIGRYLYKLETTFVEVTDARGQHYIAIKENKNDQQPKYRGYWNDPKLPSWALPTGTTTPPVKKLRQPSEDELHDLKSEINVELKILTVPEEKRGAYIKREFGFDPATLTVGQAREVLNKLRNA